MKRAGKTAVGPPMRDTQHENENTPMKRQQRHRLTLREEDRQHAGGQLSYDAESNTLMAFD